MEITAPNYQMVGHSSQTYLLYRFNENLQSDRLDNDIVSAVDSDQVAPLVLLQLRYSSRAKRTLLGRPER